MPNTLIPDVYQLAEPQHGYLTKAQAEALGISRDALRKMATRGVLERISQGVYRVVNFPPFQHGQLMEASLWPLRGIRGVISHDSALTYYQMSDVSPAKVHITVPKAYRIRRSIPKYLVVHHYDLPSHDISTMEGITITTPYRAVIDSHNANLGTALISQAIADGERKGWLNSAEAAQLRNYTRNPQGTASHSTV
jgi:predicted transcriptional regulator of viral defense system